MVSIKGIAINGLGFNNIQMPEKYLLFAKNPFSGVERSATQKSDELTLSNSAESKVVYSEPVLQPSFQQRVAGSVEILFGRLKQKTTPFDKLPVEGTEFVVFDLEFTGNRATVAQMDRSRKKRIQKGKPTNQWDHVPDDLIEVGAFKYKIVNQKPVQMASFYKLVNPEKPISNFVQELTGITEDEVEAGGVHPKDALLAFADFVGDTPLLVGHGAKGSDVPFLQGTYERYGLQPLKARFNQNHVIDTVLIAQKLYPEAHQRISQQLPPLSGQPERFKLSKLAEFFGVPNQGAHQADHDAVMTVEVLSGLLNQMKARGLTTSTWGDLFNFQNKASSHPKSKAQKGQPNKPQPQFGQFQLKQWVA